MPQFSLFSACCHHYHRCQRQCRGCDHGRGGCGLWFADGRGGGGGGGQYVRCI